MAVPQITECAFRGAVLPNAQAKHLLGQDPLCQSGKRAAIDMFKHKAAAMADSAMPAALLISGIASHRFLRFSSTMPGTEFIGSVPCHGCICLAQHSNAPLPDHRLQTLLSYSSVCVIEMPSGNIVQNA